MTTLYESNETAWNLLSRGKVRDVYEYAPNQMLIVTSDRLSAFDVILPTPIPDKGVVLTQIANFWFEQTDRIIPNHLVDPDPFSTDAGRKHLAGRSIVVHKAEALPVEASRLPEPIYTPSTKAAIGDHDENVSFGKTVDLIGREMAEKVRDMALELYRFGAGYALERGIIIADTKFEFGVLDGELILIDEAMTPDSSRFWPMDKYHAGGAQESYDKQYVRDYLESIQWNKQPPAPGLPPEVAAKTSEKYIEAYEQLTGRPLPE